MSNKTSDKNVANVEEDVKVLKDLMKELKLEKQTALHNNEYGEYITECDVLDLYDMQILALQHILAEREQKDKRIQELEIKLKCAKGLYDDCCKCLVDSIPKQVVIDKIEEIEIIKQITSKAKYTHLELLQFAINNLEELLEK